MKIREAVKCVPVILGYFLLTEFGKMIEFWIFMAHQTESDLYEQQWSWITMPESRFFQIPGRTGLLFAALIAVLLCMLAHGKDFRAGQLKKITNKLEKNIVSGNTDRGCSIGSGLYQVPGSHSLCYIHERYLFLYQRNWCTCRNTDN